MFNTTYRCPVVSPVTTRSFAESRRRYLENLAAQGAPIHTIRAAAASLAHQS